jgi:hypothetical protein
MRNLTTVYAYDQLGRVHVDGYELCEHYFAREAALVGVLTELPAWQGNAAGTRLTVGPGWAALMR